MSRTAPEPQPAHPVQNPVAPREGEPQVPESSIQQRSEEPPDPQGDDGRGNHENYATPPLVRSRQSMVEPDEPPPQWWGDLHPVSPLETPARVLGEAARRLEKTDKSGRNRKTDG